ncbi:MAG TPA: AAA family ATPase [Candidatus Limnocylindrales bacterium]|nr:AAA family ATPase [Candidatus Limnocylindrales bacterium]
MDIVGRESELEAVGRFLDEGSGARALLLTGEAGIGKSTIWQAALREAQARGYRVIGSRPTEAEARLPFAALSDLFGDLLDEVEPELPEPQQQALDAALLRAGGDGVSAAPLAVSLAVLALLRATITNGPLLLAIDDVPWMDGSSAAVLEFALRRLEAEPVRLIAAERTAAPTSALPPVIRAVEHARLQRISVGGLSLADLDQLLGSVLEMDLPPSTLKRLHRASGGNPFYAIEIARSMQRRGRNADLREFRLPDSLAGLVHDRIGALPPAAAEVVLHAAALSQPTMPIVRAAVGVDRAVRGLAEANEAGVLMAEGDVLRFAHPLLAAEAYQRAETQHRRAAHRTIAALVVEPEERAKHLALAAEGPDATVAAALEHAAERARMRGAPDAAAELAEQASLLTPSSEDDAAIRRSLAAAQYLLIAGDAARARPMLERLLERATDGAPRAGVLSQLAQVRLHMDDWEAAERLYQEALPYARSDVRQQIEIKIALAGVGYITGRNWEAAAKHISEAMGFADELGDPELQAAVIGHYATWQYATGEGLRRDLIERAAQLEPWTRPIRTMDHPDFDFALMLGAEGDRHGARVRLERLLERADESGDYSSIPFLLTNLAWTDFGDANLASARERLDRAERVARSTGEWTAFAHMLTARTHVAARMGDEADARRFAEEALALIARTGWNEGKDMILSDLGELELSLGNPAAAHERFVAAAVTSFRPGHQRRWTNSYMSGEIEALIALDRLEEARPKLDRFQAEAASASRPPDLAESQRLRGLLLAVDGRPDAAVAPLIAAVEQHRALDDGFGAARSLLTLGEVYRRTRKRAKAVESLTAALTEFNRLSARIWGDRARHELNRVKGKRDSASGLTPTQRNVAKLVVAGNTNRQVADALFMSVHTVEAHLTAVYRALGVASRGELAQRFRDSDADLRDTAPAAEAEI